MNVCALLPIALALVEPARPASVPWPTTGSLRVACPAGRTTRIVFPEPLKRLKTFGPDRQTIAVTVERTTPAAVIVLRPERHPAQCGIEFHGTTLALRLEVTTVASGADRELQLDAPSSETLPASAPIAPEPTPTPLHEPLSAVPPAPSPERPHAFAVEELPWARAVAIGRREGLPGQPALVLEDALQSEEWILYRFRLEGGAREQVTALEWEHGSLSDYLQVTEGADRRILVRVPHRLVTRRTRLVVRLASGAVYRVPPFAPTVGGLLKRLFR